MAAADTLDGFMRYDAFPQMAWAARSLPTPKFGRPQEVRGVGQPVRALAWSCDGKRVAVGSETRGLRVWEVDARGVVESERTSIPLPKGKGESPHLGNVGSVVWSPTDPNILISGCKGKGDGVVAVWDLRSPAAPVAMFTLPRTDVMHVAFHPSGTQFAAVSPGRERDEVLFYRLDAGVWVKRDDVMINGPGCGGGTEEQINSLRFGNGGKSVLGVTHDGALNSWWFPVDPVVRDERPTKKARMNSPSPEEEEEKAGETEDGADRDATPEPQAQAMAEGGEDDQEGGAEGEGEGEAQPEGDETKVAQVDGDADMADSASIPAPLASVPASAAPSPPPTTPASPVKEGTPAPTPATDAETAQDRERTEKERERAEKATRDREAREREAAERAAREAHVRSIQLERGVRKVVSTGLLLALGVDPRGRYYAIGGHDARIALLTTRQQIVKRVFDAPTAPVRHVVFSADGELLAAGGDDNAVLILAVESGQVVARVPVVGAVNALAWHPTKSSLAYSVAGKKGGGWFVVGLEETR